MKIFISWSGERSQSLAQALRDWLPMVLHFSEPWLSNADIEAGERWATQVSKELEATELGLICITRENISSSWILFEAGALAKSMQEGRVIPLLLDVEFKDIAGPLAQFQAKKFDQPGVSDVVKSINQYAQNKLQDTRLLMQFDALWPTLESKINAIPKSPSPAKSNRPQSEVLEELVTSVRGLDLRFRDNIDGSPKLRRRRLKFHPMMIEELSHRIGASRRDPVRYLFIAGYLRETFPWLCELALEVYRSANGNPSNYRENQRRFLIAFETLHRGPYLEAINDKEDIFAVQELFHILELADIDLRPDISKQKLQERTETKGDKS